MISRGFKFLAFERDEAGMPVHVYRNRSCAKFLLDPTISISETSDFDRKDLLEIEKILRLNHEEMIQKIHDFKKEDEHTKQRQGIAKEESTEQPTPSHQTVATVSSKPSATPLTEKTLDPQQPADREDARRKADPVHTSEKAAAYSGSPEEVKKKEKRPRLAMPTTDPQANDALFQDIRI